MPPHLPGQIPALELSSEPSVGTHTRSCRLHLSHRLGVRQSPSAHEVVHHERRAAGYAGMAMYGNNAAFLDGSLECAVGLSEHPQDRLIIDVVEEPLLDVFD